MNVSQILKTKGGEVISLQEGCSVAEVANVLGERRIGAIPIMNGDTLAGIISERDVVRGIAMRGGAVLEDEAASLMTRSVVTCSADATVTELMTIMTDRRIRHVPVLDGTRIIGMVTIGDVVKERLHETEMEAEALKDYIAHA